MWADVLNWMMIVLGVGPVVLGIVFGAVDRILRAKRWLQGPTDKR